MNTESTVVYISRKIQLVINDKSVEFKKSVYAKLYEWQNVCYRSANTIMTHQFIQQQIKELIYLTDGVKVRLANILKDKDGILKACKEHTTYQLLAKQNNRTIPSAILSAVNRLVVKEYNSDSADYWKGNKSLRNYKRDLPITFPAKDLKLKRIENDRNFQFTLFQLPFRTYLGKDKTDKPILLNRLITGQIKVVRCALKLEEDKLFLLATFAINPQEHSLDDSIIAEASLSLEYPITVKIDKNEYLIGNKEEFLHRRIAIQNARRRVLAGCKFNKCGKGRKRKLKAADHYQDKEKSYVDNKLHLYSKRLIQYCIKHNAGTLLLVNQEQKEELAKQEPFLLRNWSYYGLKDKLAYKAKMAGIMLVCE